MPTALQLRGINPATELPAQADPNSKLVYIDSTDSFKLKTRDDAGGDAALGGSSDIDAGTTTETDTTKRLAPDGTGGVQWVPGGGGATEYPLTTVNDTLATIFTLDASMVDRLYKVSFDLQAVATPVEQSPAGAQAALYRAIVQIMNINGVLYEVAFPFETLEEGPGLTSLDIVATISGTDVLFQVKGLPASDVKWLMEVRQASLIAFISQAPA